MATIVRGDRRAFGPIYNDTSGLAVTWRQVGGEGICCWKMLMNGMHLEGQWNCVEYVVIEPGALVGNHVHLRTEEIYFIISGHAILTMDDLEIHASPGDLITTPIGSAHSIANRGDDNMHFFVAEMFPGQGEPAKPTLVHVPDHLVDRGPIRSAELDLTPHFTGDWRAFRLIEIPAGGRLDAVCAPDRSQVAHLLEGVATVTVDGQAKAGGAGLSAAIPSGLAWSAVNRSDSGPLSIIVIEAAA